jgi:serpin B
MRITARLITVLLVGVMSAACTATPPVAPSGTPSLQPTPAATRSPASAVAELARANVSRAAADPSLASNAASATNAFGLDLFARLRAGAADDNIVFSPTSIAIALAMARAGARGETAAQMDVVLRSLGADDHASVINAFDQALNSRSGTYLDDERNPQELTLTVANAPYAQRDYSWKQAFLDALAERFGAGVRLVDYMADPEAARHEINAWVADQTQQRIPELLAQGVVDQLTRMVLVNAIYLKAPWQQPFIEEATKTGDFKRSDETPVQVPMMARTDEIPYASGDGWQAIELPYVGGTLAMDVILPDDLGAFSATLDEESFAAIVGALAPTEVELTLPRFSAETKTDLADTLAALGMPLAFSPVDADFSGMTDVDRLYISDVIHQANIDVDEKGTTAAAATAVVMRASAVLQTEKMNVDHPFLFALRDVPTGAVLFLGQITDPSRQP